MAWRPPAPASAGAAREGAPRGAKRGAQSASVMSPAPPGPGAPRTSKPAARIASRTAGAALRTAAVAPGAASRASALKTCGVRIGASRSGATPSRKKASTRATISGSQSAMSPKASSSRTRPPSKRSVCRPWTSGGQASASSRAGAASGVPACRRASASRAGGCFSIDTKSSRSQRRASARQASSVARKPPPWPKPVSSTVKARRPRQRPGRPLPARNAWRACAGASVAGRRPSSSP